MEFCGIKTKYYLNLDTSLNIFITRLNNNVFEICETKGKIYFLNSVLQNFCSYMFYRNFNPPIEYRKKVQNYVNKIIYGKSPK